MAAKTSFEREVAFVEREKIRSFAMKTILVMIAIIVVAKVVF